MNENKIKNTKIGDDIHFFVNGKEDRGIVVKMNNEYVTVFKESTQNYDDVHINDTFFIKDILINKEWDKMEDVERFELLKSIHAPTPRFLSKSWDQLPKEIKTLLTKNNGIETSHKKDEDPMDTTVRTFDKGFGGVERGNKRREGGTQGDKIEGEKPKGQAGTEAGETTSQDAGNKPNAPKFNKEGEKEQGEGHQVSNFEQHKTTEETTGEPKASDSLQLLSQQVSKDPDIAASDKEQESKLGEGAKLQDARINRKEIQDKQSERAERKNPKSDKVPKKVTTGVRNLKAWESWLDQKEQQVLKREKLIHEGSAETNPQVYMREREGKERTNISDVMDKFDITEEDATAEVEDYNSSLSKSWEERLLELKSSVETSIHGNAARNPNSGVNTNTPFDASNDYEGFTHDGIRLEQFKHEKKKPKVGKEKGKISVDGKEKPADSTQGTGDNGNAYNTATQNKDVKGRAVAGRDKK